jgi:hypothetical protein
MKAPGSHGRLIGLACCCLGVQLQAATVDVTLRNVSGATAPAAGTRFVLYTSPSRQTDSVNPASFSDVAAGTYILEGYYTGTFWGREYWASQHVPVSAGEGATIDLTRQYPYAQSVLVSNVTGGGVLAAGQGVPAGTQLRAYVTVVNGLADIALNARVRLVFDISQSQPYGEYDSTSTFQSVGALDRRAFTFDFTPTVAGQYSFAYRVDTTLLNNNTLVTDSAGWQQTFQVSSVPGRVAFHRDSNNQTLHAPVNAEDGNIFTIDLGNNSVVKQTGGLGLGNCLNPNFSPDGSAITFMAIPAGQPLSWADMRIYVLDLADRSGPLDLGSGQDPKFSPDGQSIVYKRVDGQLYAINRDGTGFQPLTSGRVERSGPNYSPVLGDGRIVFWNTTVSNQTKYGDLAWRLKDGSEQTLVRGTASRYCYYPIWRDADHILFVMSEGADDLYQYTVSGGSYAPLTGINTAAEESDPFPAGDMIGFSSTRAGSGGGYDLYLAKEDGSLVQAISAANSPLHELGGTYSPYSKAQKLTMVAPSTGAQLTAGSTVLFKARAFANGGVWANAAPAVVVQGPVNVQFAGLHDDGVSEDQLAGDGVYSLSVTLPAQTGDYSVYASATTTENGVVHEIRSARLPVSIRDAAAPRLIYPRLTEQTFTVSVPTQMGSRYVLEYAGGLGETAWTAVQTNGGNGGEITLTDPGATAATRFYRVRVQ